MVNLISGTYSAPDQERVVFGKPFEQAVTSELARIGIKRAVLFSTPPLVGPGGLVDRLRDALGSNCCAVYGDCEAHTPLESVLAAVHIVKRERADLIVAIGGSSVIDTAKIAQLFIWEQIDTQGGYDDLTTRDLSAGHDESVPIRLLAVPTTFSGSEFTVFGSVWDRRSGKRLFQHPRLVPRITVLDPGVLVGTPPTLLLSTGFKAIDHAIETLCSPIATPISDASAIRAFTLLHGALRSIKRDPSNLVALLNGQFGVWLSLMGLSSGVPYGASHALGYVLGSEYDVPHGYTSCLTLPAVTRWNFPACGPKQQAAVEALGMGSRSLGSLLDDLLDELELPTKLGQFGITRDDLPAIAEKAFRHGFMNTNSRSVQSPEDVVAMLEHNL